MEMEMKKEKQQEEEQWERIWIGFPGNAMHMWASPKSNKASVPSRMLWFHAPSQSWGIIFYSGIKLFWLSLIISAFSLCLLWFFPCRRNANQITRNVCVCVSGWGWGRVSAPFLLPPSRTGLLPSAAEALLREDDDDGTLAQYSRCPAAQYQK